MMSRATRRARVSSAGQNDYETFAQEAIPPIIYAKGRRSQI